MRPRGRGDRASRIATLAACLGPVAVWVVVASASSVAGADEPMSPAPTVSAEPSPTSEPPTVDPSPDAAAPGPTPSDEPVPSVTPTPGLGTSTAAPPTPARDDPRGPEAPTGPGRRARVRFTVSAVDDAFRPMELTVMVGDEIVWTNQGLNPHTVTADDRSFDSGTLETGEGYSVTFDRVGEVPYYCQIHGEPGSGMFGIVIVRAASEEGGEEAADPVSASPTSGVLAGTGTAGTIPLALAAFALAMAGLTGMWVGRWAARRRG